ncbi:transporter [Noviherbaspirillum cavernae]|uniref:Transporter n=2 Tax=Noviherbaspirillum cavernae TaxID=2320862 RepID=A0A418X5W5_9BURK|nr:transporter [Noviherbaspirillum cavernae]
MCAIAAIGAALGGGHFAAHATEGGVGRPITGQQVFSNAGIVPPEPGWVAQFSSIYYKGDMGGNRAVPIVGNVGAGIDMKVSYNIANLTRVWGTGPGGWSYASAIGLPLQYTKVQTSLTTVRRDIGNSDDSTQFADMLFTPIAAGYHFSKTEHLSLSLPIYAPTGSYDPNRLANAGQNVWTFMPTVAYTRLDGKGGEFSVLSALEFYTRNNDTDYKSGTLFRIDALWTVGLKNGWSVGAVGGWIEQISDDSSPLADRVGGFRGSAFGIGPVVNWGGKLGNLPGSFSARWVPDWTTDNRPKGNGFSLSFVLQF